MRMDRRVVICVPKNKTYLRTSSYSAHCWCCKGFGGAESNKEPLAAAAGVGDLGSAGCRETDAEEVPEGLGVGAMGSGPAPDSEKVLTGGESRDGAGVDVVDGLHRA